jgi:hypothetical protein
MDPMENAIVPDNIWQHGNIGNIVIGVVSTIFCICNVITTLEQHCKNIAFPILGFILH